MAIDPENIQVGLCYVTSSSQVRKVLSVDGDKVKYASRGRKCLPNWDETAHFDWTTKQIFAIDVDREVTCDWDPDYPERNPS